MFNFNTSSAAMYPLGCTCIVKRDKGGEYDGTEGGLISIQAVVVGGGSGKVFVRGEHHHRHIMSSMCQ